MIRSVFVSKLIDFETGSIIRTILFVLLVLMMPAWAAYARSPDTNITPGHHDINMAEWRSNYPVMAFVRDIRVLNIIVLVLGLAGGIYFIGIYIPRRFKSKVDSRTKPSYKSAQNPEYCKTLPDDTHPAVLSNLLKQSFFCSLFKGINAKHMYIAAMLNLLAKNFLVARKNESGDMELCINSKKPPTHNHEQIMFSLIATASAKPRRVGLSAAPGFMTLNDFKKYIKSNKKKILGVKNQFEKAVEAEALKSQYIEGFMRNRSGLAWFYLLMLLFAVCYGVFVSLLLTAILAGSGGMFFIVASIVAFIILSAVAAGCTLGEKGITNSQFGIDQATLWSAFGKYLEDFAALKEKEFPELKHWVKYLVYAAALGKSKELIKELSLLYPAENINTSDSWHARHSMMVELITGDILFDAIELLHRKR